MLFRILILLGSLCLLPGLCLAQTYRAGAGCTYATIQDAVDAIASNGSGTIRATDETFEESVTIVNKSITLIGGHTSCSAPSASGHSRLDASGTNSPPLNLMVTSGSHTLHVERIDLRDGTGVVAPFVPFPGGGLNVWTAAGTSATLIVDNIWIYSNTTEYQGGGIALHGEGSGIVALRNNTRIFSNQVTGDDAFGGGLFCSGDYAIVMRGGRIGNNTAGSTSAANGRGGGVYLDGCTMSWFAHPGAGAVSGLAELDYNTAHGYGGGLYATGGADVFLRGIHDASPQVSTGPFVIRSNNAVDDGSAGIIGFGGAIYATGAGTTVTADRSWIHDHSVPRNGGAVHVRDGAVVTIERAGEACHNPRNCSRLFDNGAAGVGGAVYVADAGSRVNIQRSKLTDNTGRPFYANEGGTIEITDSLVHGASATDYTFTAFASMASSPTTAVRIRRSTVADTTPSQNIFRLVNDPARLTLYDSIVHETGPVSIIGILAGSPGMFIDCVLWHQSPPGVSATRTVVADPLFGDRSSGNYYLKSGSRAINFCDVAPPAPGVDLDWNPRGITQDDPSVLHGPYDLGAYEIEDTMFGDRFED